MRREFSAQVIAAFGRRVTVRGEDGVVRPARPFGRRLSLVCGDRVRCAHQTLHDEVHVLETFPRRSVLCRASSRGDSEPVVANLDLLAVVVAPRPPPDFFIVDRYLAAAESAGIGALIVANKSDLEVDVVDRAEIEVYSRIGYASVDCSAKRGGGLDALRAALAEHTVALVGQSGVGKSSIVRALVPDANAATGKLARDEQGRHTTTASRLYDLPDDGHLIDSPGVRDFAPAIDRLEPRSLGFRDVAALAKGCRFLDCRHIQEPQCAVREAVAGGKMHWRRYESYRRLRRLYEELRRGR
jgi:ribosome biogenesis GTPase